MSIKRRYGQSKSRSAMRYVYMLLSGIILLWLILSLVFKINPIELLKSSFSNFGQSVESSDHSDSTEQLAVLTAKDSLIIQLEEQLAICRGEKDYHKALVSINGNHLNLRSSGSLSSDVLLQIPAGSIVDILYYDKETFFLDGKKGNWVKIIYADKEGWVWGNYLEKLEADDPALDTIPDIE